MRRILRVLASVLSVCAGATSLSSCPGYVVPPFEPVVKSFTYTPASPIHVNDTLTFQATVDDAEIKLVRVKIDGAVHHWLDLNDAGLAPDALASDGVWTGALFWQANLGTGEQLQVAAWAYRNPTVAADSCSYAPPLTVLP